MRKAWQRAQKQDYSQSALISYTSPLRLGAQAHVLRRRDQLKLVVELPQEGGASRRDVVAHLVGTHHALAGVQVGQVRAHLVQRGAVQLQQAAQRLHVHRVSQVVKDVCNRWSPIHSRWVQL